MHNEDDKTAQHEEHKERRRQALADVIKAGFKQPQATNEQAATMADWIIAELAKRGIGLTEIGE